ncbi:hypothetical protein AAZX31_01G072300 [Glycine max]|nr:hypothetical protein GLYMA_01G079250v4 [Glycine max]KAG4403300.1 hypothetical protein GLYMA_01G079250v4 [Glycine max]KAG4403301.1 hypothetical protein GLYMA_01G079250v4 [Glycine max]KAH1162137.1 hypothetical protein GYH30_000851 [Glycine max]KAH1162138.1 hypothetical protein GYH30_000851 [Glycine max]
MASRKRARTEDIPSSSNPFPSTTTMEPDAQQAHSLIPMLQSLFRGQLMIVYNQQELAHNRPIISMEQFLEKVAWPEAHLPLERSHEVVPPELVLARIVVSPGPVPTRTEPTSAEPQSPVIDPPVSLGLEILSPLAPPLIIIPNDSTDEAHAPPNSPSCNIDDGSDFSSWMDC